MKLHLQYVKISGPKPPISYKPDSTDNMKPESKSDPLKVYIKT